MKGKVKKNQLIIVALAVMIAAKRISELHGTSVWRECERNKRS